MDKKISALGSTGRDETDHIMIVHSPDIAEEEKEPKVLSDEDRVNQMTLTTAVTPNTSQPQTTNVVTRQPGATQNMRPENYVISLENLNETPDYIDCPYCKSRQITKIRHESSSQTTLAAAICCLCCGIIPVVIPFLCNWCADTNHYCEGCKRQVAHKPHEGKTEAVLPPISPSRPGVDARY
ncbi:LITAF-like zinc ribbon domain-containing protein [Trichoderma barbatum]